MSRQSRALRPRASLRSSLLALSLGVGVSCGIGWGATGEAWAQTEAEKVVGPEQAPRDGTRDPVLAIVNGLSIRRSEVLDAAKRLSSKYSGLPLEMIYKPIVDKLIDVKLIAAEGREKGLERDPEVKRRVYEETDRIIQEVFLTRYLEENITEQGLRQRYSDYIQRATVRQVTQIRHILINDEQRARDLHKKLKAGADFAKLAREWSLGPEAEKGGLIETYLGDGDSLPSPAVVQVAIRLKKGELIPQPLRSDIGWHIIKVVDRKEAKAPSFREVRERLVAEWSEELIRDLAKALREKASIQRFDLKSELKKETMAKPGGQRSGTAPGLGSTGMGSTRQGTGSPTVQPASTPSTGARPAKPAEPAKPTDGGGTLPYYSPQTESSEGGKKPSYLDYLEKKDQDNEGAGSESGRPSYYDYLPKDQQKNGGDAPSPAIEYFPKPASGSDGKPRSQRLAPAGAGKLRQLSRAPFPVEPAADTLLIDRSGWRLSIHPSALAPMFGLGETAVATPRDRVQVAQISLIGIEEAGLPQLSRPHALAAPAALLESVTPGPGPAGGGEGERGALAPVAPLTTKPMPAQTARPQPSASGRTSPGMAEGEGAAEAAPAPESAALALLTSLKTARDGTNSNHVALPLLPAGTNWDDMPILTVFNPQVSGPQVGGPQVSGVAPASAPISALAAIDKGEAGQEAAQPLTGRVVHPIRPSGQNVKITLPLHPED